MPRKSKKFIDRKNAVTFHLVHRSQQDPLIADETAPQRVLVPEKSKNVKKHLEEQQKYGIFFDDDYNYLQHLRDASATMDWEKIENVKKGDAKIILPSSVFASNVEENIGLLNKAAPQSGLRLDLDPDVVAAMDDDFDYSDPENELEDNFIELANAEVSDDDEEGDNISSDFDSEEDRDEVASLNGPQYSFREEETKSRFTDYSMTSSVIRRNDQLTLLDDRFEKMYAGYDENEIGSLECEEIEGYVPPDSNMLLQCAEEFEKQQRKEHLDKSAIIKCIELQDDAEDDPPEELMAVKIPEDQKWDCESILSTYSNIYNHPKLITEPPKQKIKINMRTGMPVDVLGSNKLTSKALLKHNEQNEMCGSQGPKSVGLQSVISTLSTLSVRPRDETPEQRKERKKLLRGYRKERRVEKKINAQAFKEEAKRQVKIAINNKNNVQGNRIL